jgi:hypothetical protein
MQETIIEPIDREITGERVNQDKFLRSTNYGNNEIYITTHHNSPNVMLEVGRLREVVISYSRRWNG